MKDLYPPGTAHPATEHFARRGDGNLTGSPPLPDGPTAALPGTPEKLAVLRERVLAGRALHHPADARGPGDPAATDAQERFA